MARQFYFDHAHLLLLRALDALVGRAHRRNRRQGRRRKSSYHVERSADWVIRLGDGTDGVARAHAGGARSTVAVHRRDVRGRRGRRRADRRGRRGRTPRALRDPWLAGVRAVLDEATLAMPDRRMDARRAARRAASRACTPSISAICWPRCSSCSARIRARSGDAPTLAANAARCPEAVELAPSDVPRSASSGRGRCHGDASGTRLRRPRSRDARRSRSSSSASCATCRVRAARVRVEVTPTYSGCPATELIAHDRSASGSPRSACPTSIS